MSIKFIFNEKLLDKMSKEKRRITLEDVKRETGISKNALSNLGKETLSGIKFDTLEALCLYFNCTPNDLMIIRPARLRF